MLDKLSEMKMFQAVADSGGFTAAANDLGVSQSAVSRAVLRLEQRLGTSLLHRSTRRISLTDEGDIFLRACRQVLEDIGEAERSVTSDKRPVGTLRVSAAVLWGLDPLVPLLPEFTSRYPKIGVHLSLTDRYIDLIDEKIDVAIRVGRLADSSLIARKIGEMRRVIVASPAYIARRGKPKTPADLLNHDCLLWDEEHDYLNRWTFEVNGVVRHIKVRAISCQTTRKPSINSQSRAPEFFEWWNIVPARLSGAANWCRFWSDITMIKLFPCMPFTSGQILPSRACAPL